MLRDGATSVSRYVDVIDDAARFAALRAPWTHLLARSAAESPFLTWEWLYAWWIHLRGGRTLHLLTVRQGDELIAIAPLARVRGPLPWLSRLEFLGTGYAGSDYLDLIVHRDYEAEAIDEIAKALESESSALHLDHLPVGSLASRLVRPVSASGWSSMTTASGRCPVISLAGQTWESYLASIGSAHRANFRRRLRGLDRQFEVRFDRVRTEAERQTALATLIDLHNRRWDTRGGSTAFPTDACCAFHDHATRLALECDRLRLYVLRANDVAVAMTYCFAGNGTFYFYQGAFDERYREHSVGLVAMGLTIQAAIDEGAREFDMLYGEESYKWLWARETRQLERLEMFPAHIGGRLHHRTVEAERSMRRLARRFFPRRSCEPNIRPAGAVC